MGKVRATNIEPEGATTNMTISGTTATFASTETRANTFKDAGSNVLWTSDGAGTLSSVNSGLAGGGWTLISTTTAVGQASIAITANIDSTYEVYAFVFTDVNPATDQTYFSFQCSTDGGLNYNTEMTTTAYRGYQPETTSGGIDYLGNADSGSSPWTSYQWLFDNNQQGSGADECMAGILHLFSPSNTAFATKWLATTVGYSFDNIAANNYWSGYFDVAAAINAVSFKQSSGNIDAVIQMYGIS